MKKLILASCTADVYLYVDQIPSSSQDAKVMHKEMVLGGCGYHVAKACEEAILFCPLGQGIYGDFVRQHLLNEDLECLLYPVKEDNGVCYCMIEENGQRTFLSDHGAEYHYAKEMFSDLPPTDWIYVSGIDLEEKQNQCVIDYLNYVDANLFFSPGPRVTFIPVICEKMLKRRPVLHMNKEECESWTRRSMEEGMKYLWDQTQRPVIVTDSFRGSYAYDGEMVYVPSVPVCSTNVTGAGDTHAGSCLDSLSQGLDLETMLKKANQKASEKIIKKEGIL